MSHRSRFHCGVVVFGTEADMLDRFSRIVAATFEDYGHPVDRNSLQTPRTARILGSHHVVKLSMMQGITPGEHAKRSMCIDAIGGINTGHAQAAKKHWRIQIDMTPMDPVRDDREISEMLLAVMLHRICAVADVRMIEWLDPLTVMNTADFLSAFAAITPEAEHTDDAMARIADPRLAPVPEYGSETPAPVSPEDRLAIVFRSEPLAADASVGKRTGKDAEAGPSDVSRLAVWGMTGMIAFMSAPVAASVAAVNLIRGEDFRLNTHVLALTGLTFMLHSTGALESAVAALPL
ncbi:hypothetical protein [Arenibacterium halophilum]|uniref:Uncharacterized protein n=1 Tax=Arenibacterium halophilum TaxID=2583821 RepID=A0ABY2XA94_9RHOB|nr:hypothetical protein [Arenibacterium halophilum]TMV13291.1 hypothetical protein FGK64_11090 [Arenibacterium halophilum]